MQPVGEKSSCAKGSRQAIERHGPLRLQLAEGVLEAAECMLYFLAHTAELLVVQSTAHGLACGASGGDSQLGRSVRAETAAVAAVRDVSE